MNQFLKYPADCVCMEKIQNNSLVLENLEFNIAEISQMNSTSLGNINAVYKLGLDKEKFKAQNYLENYLQSNTPFPNILNVKIQIKNNIPFYHMTDLVGKSNIKSIPNNFKCLICLNHIV